MPETFVNDFEFETAERPEPPQRSNSAVWQWIAGVLFSLLMLSAGSAIASLRGGISRAEAEHLLASPANPYVAERSALNRQLDEMNTRQQQIMDQLTRLSIALGVQPDGTVVQRPRK